MSLSFHTLFRLIFKKKGEVIGLLVGARGTIFPFKKLCKPFHLNVSFIYFIGLKSLKVFHCHL